ncbi:hypothetical protein ACIGXM_24200 [Kitasatospora sp. NPDC052896]|uniref:hypothetical protein n=1 Tax=Kitasatospora sp. NPDC052896 TaxID=3364061 RepID=UPI0037C79A5A
MEAIGVLVGLAALIGISIVVLLVVAAVKATKAVAAKVEQTEATARRAVENVTLKARTFTKPGSQGELAAVRLGLRTSLVRTREVLESGVGADGQLAEALRLLTRLDAHAAELDGELRMLEREPEPSRVAARLPELRERAERITRSAESMRWAAQDRMHRFAEDELSRLSAECESEAGALRHWDTGGSADASAGRAAAGSGGTSFGRPSSGAEARAGIAAAVDRASAEDVLGLGEPLARLAQRLRKPAPGSSTG